MINLGPLHEKQKRKKKREIGHDLPIELYKSDFIM